MTTISTLLSAEKSKLDAAKKRRAAAADEAEAMLKRIEQQNRKANPSEQIKLDELLSRINDAKSERDEITAKLERLSAIAEEERQFDVEASTPSGSYRRPTRPNYDSAVRVTSEPDVFRQDEDPHGIHFMRTVGAAHFGSAEAQQKLARHDMQMRAGETGVTADYTGHVIPQYLMSLAADAINARSNFRDLAHTVHPLPEDGMTLEVPYASVATSAAEQTTQLTSVSTTQMGTDLLAVPVRTYAAGQILSRQSVERGTGLEEFTLRDMQSQLAAKVDYGLLNTATYGALAVAQDTPFTGDSAEDLYQAIADAASLVETALDGIPADRVVMDTATWTYLSKALTNTHPLVGNNGVNLGQLGSPEYSRIRGVLPNGLAVVVDNHVPLETTTHTVLVVPRLEAHLWQSGVTLIRAEDTLALTLGVELVVYEYVAFTYQRHVNALASVGAIDVTPGA